MRSIDYSSRRDLEHADPSIRNIIVSHDQLLHLLSLPGVGTLLGSGDAQTEENQLSTGNDGGVDDENGESLLSMLGYGRRPRRRANAGGGDLYPKIPSKEGQQLMESGAFGVPDRCSYSGCGVPYSERTLQRQRRVSRRIFDRELGQTPRGRAEVLHNLATQTLIPRSKADFIINMPANCYSGQFSEDGAFFFACSQDFKVRLYDTSNPYDWTHVRTIPYIGSGAGWTITDASLSPDNGLLAISSIQSQVTLAVTDKNTTRESRTLDFADMGQARGSRHQPFGARAWSRRGFGIWSLRFSGDGREIVAGTSDDSVYVYDLEKQQSILQIPAHDEHVNAVCFGEQTNPHVLYSGSDDTTLKVWDRRSLHDMRPAGMFLGHTAGLTYIDSKGDGRYVISNSKDQTCKLWDLRRMVSTDVGEKVNHEVRALSHNNPLDARLTRASFQDFNNVFDYRHEPYPVQHHSPHPHDCSLVTFRGHRVLRTLIRCHFSPQGSSDGRYVYSGSHDGKVFIWNLDGTLAGEPIDVCEATKPALREGRTHTNTLRRHLRGWKTIVRDCSWHPSAPIIAATSWTGYGHQMGTCSVHSWSEGDSFDDAESTHSPGRSRELQSSGAMPVGARLTPRLNIDEEYYDLYEPAMDND